MSRVNFLLGQSGDANPIAIGTVDRRFAIVPTEQDPAIAQAQAIGRTRRKPKKPRAITWPAPAPLQPIAWGQRDEILGPAVCSWIETAMPTTLWEYTPQRKGWLAWLFS